MLKYNEMPHKTLVKLKWTFNAISLLFLAVIPIVIVAIRYDFINLRTETAIPGFAIICLLIIAIAIIKWISKCIKQLNQLDPTKITLNQRYMVSILNMLKKLIFPLFAIFFILATLDNIHFSAITIMYISISFCGSFLVDGIFTDVIKSQLAVDTSIFGENEYESRKSAIGG